MRRSKTLRWLGGLVLIALLAGRASADSLGSYNFYPTAVEGSARSVGLGGATVGYPDGYAATFVNPAGLGGLAGNGVDFGSDSNNIDNLVLDPDNPKAKALNDPIHFSFYGFRYVTESGWGFGFAAQEPYQLDDLFNGTAKVNRRFRCGTSICNSTTTGQDVTELQATSNIYTLAAAKSYLDQRLSVGVAANYIQVAETYDFNPVFTTTAPIHRYVNNDAFSADLGVLARPWPWLRVGAVYKMGYRVAFDPSRNLDTLGSKGPVAAFRDGKSPDRFSMGLAVSPNKYFNIFAQSNLVFKTRDTVVVGSGLFPGGTNVLAIGQYNTLDGHWGAEFIPIDEPDLTFKLWAGGYLENTGVQGGYTRYHRTAGFGFSPWFLNLSMAIDDTEFYNNFTVGLGVDLLQVAARVAKTYGWKLPL